MSLGNSAGPENPLGVISVQTVRPDKEFDVLTAFSLHPLWAFSLTLVPLESYKVSHRRVFKTLLRLPSFPCIIVGEPKIEFFQSGERAKNAKNDQKWQVFKSSFYNSFMSLGNSAGPEYPLGVIFMQNVRTENEFDVLTAFSLHPLRAFSLTLVPGES